MAAFVFYMYVSKEQLLNTVVLPIETFYQKFKKK